MEGVALCGDETIELTTHEVFLLRFTCDLIFDDESAFGPLVDRPEQELLQRGASTLVEKGLADRKTYRPHRELLRRLLVVAQPDCRIVLLLAGPEHSERRIDMYGRAGAFVAYQRAGSRHRLGAPLELVDVVDEVLAHFTARRAAGDFIDLHLTSTEYSAFSSAAVDLAEQMNRPSALVPKEIAGDEWREALHGLGLKDVIKKSGDGYALRGYLQDLALGLASGVRYVLTRYNFVEPSPGRSRDAILVHVPGSLFWLSSSDGGGIRIREIGLDELKKTVRATLDISDPAS